MLKILSAGCLQGRLRGVPAWGLGNATDKNSFLLRVLGSSRQQKGNAPAFCRRAFFCSESSGDGSGSDKPVEGCTAEEVDSAAADGGGAEEVEAKTLSAIVPTNPRPEDHLSVIALPLPHRPLFPGFYMPIYVKDPKLLQALVENRKRSAPYAGAFLLKDEPGMDGSESEKNISDLKGKGLFKRLHEVGTLAQITSIQGEQVVLIGHRRLRITEMVDEDPLTVKVDHLKCRLLIPGWIKGFQRACWMVFILLVTGVKMLMEVATYVLSILISLVANNCSTVRCTFFTWATLLYAHLKHAMFIQIVLRAHALGKN